jgi:membrane protease YdiL (CAAX protease family)
VTAWWQRHRLATAIGLEIAAIALTLIGAAVLSALLPGLPGYSVTGPSHSLVLVVVLAVAVLAVIGLMRWWRLAGFTPPSQWRQPQLFVLPIVLLAAPFVAGVHPLPAVTVGLLLLAYLATAVYEESLWRGAILGLLRPTGVWRAVLLSSLLFGLGHLANSALRGLSLLILAQAFGAAVQGVGLAALRLRTNTVWPLIPLHALHDVFLQLGNLPIPLIEVPIDTIFLIYGIVLLRRRPAAATDSDPARAR